MEIFCQPIWFGASIVGLCKIEWSWHIPIRIPAYILSNLPSPDAFRDRSVDNDLHWLQSLINGWV